jgi:hypothetical protein
MPRQLAPGLEIVPRLAARVAWYDRSGRRVRVVKAGKLYAVEGSAGLRVSWGDEIQRYVGASGGAIIAYVGEVKREVDLWVIHPLGDGWRSVETAPEQFVAKAFVSPNAGIRSQLARGGLGVGFEASFAMSTDLELQWAQFVYYVALR